MKRALLTILILIISVCFSNAQNVSEDYEKLSSLSCERLMEEGRQYFQKKEPAKALSRFLIVGERHGSNADRKQAELKARALNNAGCVYKYFYYDYPLAYDYLNRSYSLCEEIGYNEFLPVVMLNLGDLLSDYGNAYNSETVLKESENIFKECFKKSVANNDWNLLITTFYNISNLNYNINLKDYNAIFSKEIPEDTPDLKYVRLQYEGIKNIQQKKYAEARELFKKQMQVINAPWEASRDTISTLINIAETYRLENNFKDATAPLQEALAISQKSQNIELSSYIANMLKECYGRINDTVSENKYHNIYLTQREKLNSSRLSNIGELKYISDLKKEEMRAQEISARNRSFRLMILGLSIILLTILVSIVVIIRKNRVLNNRNKSLYDKYSELLEKETKKKISQSSPVSLNDSRREELAKKIEEVMSDAEVVVSPDFSLKQLSAMVDSNTTYVSKVINEEYGVSFSTLLGNTRVKVACRRINEDKMYLQLTIEAIARSVGFKSRTAFINTFKREVGITPSQFIKLASEEEKKKK